MENPFEKDFLVEKNHVKKYNVGDQELPSVITRGVIWHNAG
jgi:hypothetical protein